MDQPRERRRTADVETEKRLLEIEQTTLSLEKKIDSLQQDVSDLVSAWKAASWLVSAVKWLGGLALAITALTAYVKGIR